MHPTWTAAARAARPRPLAMLSALVTSLAALLWCWVCTAAYSAGARPKASFASNQVLLRPKPEDFRDAGDTHVKEAVAALRDRTQEAASRLDRYAREAALARDLYAASLSGRAHQPLTIARLAALRFEEVPPLTEEGWADWSRTLEFAGSMAPRNAVVQSELAELLVRMGRPEEGLAAFARALRLDSRHAIRAVTVLSTFGVAPEAAAAALPRNPSVLLALKIAYEREQRLTSYADLLEPGLPSAGSELLTAWADARLKAGQAHRVIATLKALGEFHPSDREAHRCVELSRAALALGDPISAVHWAERARTAAPTNGRALEQSAAATLSAGDAEASIGFSRKALVALARVGATPGWRARVYEIAGQAEELRGRMDAAHDAYTHALALDPNRAISSRRLEAMRIAAGIGVPSGAR